MPDKKDEPDERCDAAPEGLTDAQLDEVVGAGGDEAEQTHDARLPKSYPPWPGSG